MGEMSFDFPPELRRWIEVRLAEGRYADAADYMRDLVRRDQEQASEWEEDAAWVREKVEEGLASGFINRDAREVLREIVAERRAGRG